MISFIKEDSENLALNQISSVCVLPSPSAGTHKKTVGDKYCWFSFGPVQGLVINIAGLAVVWYKGW